MAITLARVCSRGRSPVTVLSVRASYKPDHRLVLAAAVASWVHAGVAGAVRMTRQSADFEMPPKPDVGVQVNCLLFIHGRQGIVKAEPDKSPIDRHSTAANSGVSDPTSHSTALADLFRHVSAEKAALYRSVMETFAAAKRQFRLHMRPDEVLSEVVEDEHREARAPNRLPPVAAPPMRARLQRCSASGYYAVAVRRCALHTDPPRRRGSVR